MEDAKVGHAEGEVAVGAGAGGEEEAVARAVHRLEAEFLAVVVFFFFFFFLFFFVSFFYFVGVVKKKKKKKTLQSHQPPHPLPNQPPSLPLSLTCFSTSTQNMLSL